MALKLKGRTYTKIKKALPISFYRRPAEVVAPDLIGCRLVKRKDNGAILWGVIVETEAYSQDEESCHGNKYRGESNETLFGDPGQFYIYQTRRTKHV